MVKHLKGFTQMNKYVFKISLYFFFLIMFQVD